jgi:hypothetical protein
MATGIVIFSACFIGPILLLFVYALCKAAKTGDRKIRRLKKE